jgi:hypothetical protein
MFTVAVRMNVQKTNLPQTEIKLDCSNKNIIIEHYTQHKNNNKNIIEPKCAIDTEITVTVCSSAKLEDLQNFITRSNIASFNLIIVCGGICNLTERKVIGKIKFLEYHDGAHKVNQLKDTIAEISKLSNKVIIGNITPASLIQYFCSQNRGSVLAQAKSTELDQQQQQLPADIESLNSFIASELPNRYINLANSATTKSLLKRGANHKRKSKFNPNKLPDGVHPSTKLKSDWARVIYSAIEYHKSLLN